MARMSAERLNKARNQLQNIVAEDFEKVRALTNIVKPLRSFIHKTPDDHGMTEWQDLSIPSDDGTPLEARYIPAKGAIATSL